MKKKPETKKKKKKGDGTLALCTFIYFAVLGLGSALATRSRQLATTPARQVEVGRPPRRHQAPPRSVRPMYLTFQTPQVREPAWSTEPSGLFSPLDPAANLFPVHLNVSAQAPPQPDVEPPPPSKNAAAPDTTVAKPLKGAACCAHLREHRSSRMGSWLAPSLPVPATHHFASPSLTDTQGGPGGSRSSEAPCAGF